MVYLPSNFNNYKYLVSYSDNYLVLSDSSFIAGDFNYPDEVDILIAYMDSPQYIETTYTSYSSRFFDNISSQISNDFSVSTFYPNYVIIGFIYIIFTLFIINQFTKLFKKGGVFSSN